MIEALPRSTRPSVAATRVVVGMSGGVDSSVTALLLQRQGYQVSGVFMKNWEETDPSFPCTAADDARDAANVCDRLGLGFDAIEFVREYWERVFEYFLAEHRLGRTPNPDILSNKKIKNKTKHKHTMRQGADCIATGHYARVRETNGEYQLLKACDTGKDQTYFLYTLIQSQLARTLFPLGELQKSEVRRIAAEAGCANAAKKDSTGVCFIGERDFSRFLSRYLPARPGDIRSADGELLGRHQGLMHYTLGQRKGLGIGGRSDAEESPWYVADKDLASNTLLVVQGHDHALLFSRGLVARDIHWIAGEAPALPLACHAKTRYRQPDQACTVSLHDDGDYAVMFIQPHRAVTPGQSVVLYHGERCLGGGIIDRLIHRSKPPSILIQQEVLSHDSSQHSRSNPRPRRRVPGRRPGARRRTRRPGRPCRRRRVRAQHLRNESRQHRGRVRRCTQSAPRSGTDGQTGRAGTHAGKYRDHQIRGERPAPRTSIGEESSDAATHRRRCGKGPRPERALRHHARKHPRESRGLLHRTLSTLTPRVVVTGAQGHL